MIFYFCIAVLVFLVALLVCMAWDEVRAGSWEPPPPGCLDLSPNGWKHRNVDVS